MDKKSLIASLFDSVPIDVTDSNTGAVATGHVTAIKWEGGKRAFIVTVLGKDKVDVFVRLDLAGNQLLS